MWPASRYHRVFVNVQPEIFFSVMSGSTWSEVLSETQRQRLRQFLPHFAENNTSEQDRVISDLFNDQNFHFGNPLHLAQRHFRGNSLFLTTLPFLLLHICRAGDHRPTGLSWRIQEPSLIWRHLWFLFLDGYFNPEVVKYRQLCAKSQRKRQIYSLQQYYHDLLKQILVSRKVRCVKTWRVTLLSNVLVGILYLFDPLLAGVAGPGGQERSGAASETSLPSSIPKRTERPEGPAQSESDNTWRENWMWRHRCVLGWRW